MIVNVSTDADGCKGFLVKKLATLEDACCAPLLAEPLGDAGAAELAAGRLQVFDLIDQANRDH